MIKRGLGWAVVTLVMKARQIDGRGPRPDDKNCWVVYNKEIMVIH